MVLLKFFKQQNWWYGVPCIVLFVLAFPIFSYEWPTIPILLSFSFLLIYGFKFYKKETTSIVERIRLGLFSLYGILPIFIYWGDRYLGFFIAYMILIFTVIIVISYIYSILLFINSQKEIFNMRRLKTYILIIQTFILLFVIVWAISQKVEADKRTEQAIYAQARVEEMKKIAFDMTNSARVIKEFAEKTKEEMTIQKELALKANDEVLKYKTLYEYCYKYKK